MYFYFDEYKDMKAFLRLAASMGSGMVSIFQFKGMLFLMAVMGNDARGVLTYQIIFNRGTLDADIVEIDPKTGIMYGGDSINTEHVYISIFKPDYSGFWEEVIRLMQQRGLLYEPD